MPLNKLISMAEMRSNKLFTIDEDKEVHVKIASPFVHRIRSLSTPDADNSDKDSKSIKAGRRRIRSFSTPMEFSEEPKTVIEFQKMINDVNERLGLSALKR